MALPKSTQLRNVRIIVSKPRSALQMLHHSRLPTQPFLQVSIPPSNPSGSGDKESACNVGDLGLIPGLGRSPGKWRMANGNPFQYSCLEKTHEQKSLVGYSPWSRKELDETERLTLPLSHTLRLCSNTITSANLLRSGPCTLCPCSVLACDSTHSELFSFITSSSKTEDMSLQKSSLT